METRFVNSAVEARDAGDVAASSSKSFWANLSKIMGKFG